MARGENRIHEVERVLANARRLRSEEHTSELQSHQDLVCRLLLEKKNILMSFSTFSPNCCANRRSATPRLISLNERLERRFRGAMTTSALSRCANPPSWRTASKIR